jgi:hypothetical protein
MERQCCSPALELAGSAVNVADWHDWLLDHTKDALEWEFLATDVIGVLRRLSLRLVSDSKIEDIVWDLNSATVLIDQAWTAWLKVMKTHSVNLLNHLFSTTPAALTVDGRRNQAQPCPAPVGHRCHSGRSPRQRGPFPLVPVGSRERVGTRTTQSGADGR